MIPNHQGSELLIFSCEGGFSGYINELIRLDEMCLADYEQAWATEAFMMDLPDKSCLSKLAMMHGNLMGYVICSSYQDRKKYHVHRLAVHPERRRLGIAIDLLRESVREGMRLEIGEVTVETPNKNEAAKNLYINLGFKRLDGTDLRTYLSQKDKEQRISEFNHTIEGRGAYSTAVKDLFMRLGN